MSSDGKKVDRTGERQDPDNQEDMSGRAQDVSEQLRKTEGLVARSVLPDRLGSFGQQVKEWRCQHSTNKDKNRDKDCYCHEKGQHMIGSTRPFTKPGNTPD